MVLHWLQFLLCCGVIVYCGVNLSRYGDMIAEKTGMGRAWTGLILMAGVTSLPELITGISSVALTDAPDIAVGDVMGSCIFNLSLIALMDILHGPPPIFAQFPWSLLGLRNLSGSRLRRLQFFPGTVKLRESSGKAGGLPKGNY